MASETCESLPVAHGTRGFIEIRLAAAVQVDESGSVISRFQRLIFGMARGAREWGLDPGVAYQAVRHLRKMGLRNGSSLFETAVTGRTRVLRLDTGVFHHARHQFRQKGSEPQMLAMVELGYQRHRGLFYTRFDSGRPAGCSSVAPGAYLRRRQKIVRRLRAGRGRGVAGNAGELLSEMNLVRERSGGEDPRSAQEY